MFSETLIPFLAVALAELGDKTQLALFCLSSQTRKHFQMLFGAIVAFTVTSGAAVLLGDFVSELISPHILKHISGILFIFFGVLTLWNNRAKNTREYKIHNPFFTSFFMVLLAEFGDKSQITTGLFATKYNPVFVFVGVLLALAILSALAIWLGKTLLRKLPRRKVAVIAGIVFIAIGIAFQL